MAGVTQPRPSAARSGGFTLIEIMIVVVIIGVISAAVVLSVNLTGRDQDLEKEGDRLLSLVNYAREQAELQTREYGVIFHDDGYQFLTYDAHRARWREVFEDDALRLRRLPYGLDVRLIVDARPVVLTPTGNISNTPAPQKEPPKTLGQIKDLAGAQSLKDSVSSGKRLGEDVNQATAQSLKQLVPQVMIYSNGDLSSFEITLEREGGVRSITLAIDEKGQVIAKPMVETKT